MSPQAAVAVAETTRPAPRRAESALPELVLRFDFKPAASKIPAPSPSATHRTAPQSIKDALARWLDEQL